MSSSLVDCCNSGCATPAPVNIVGPAGPAGSPSVLTAPIQSYVAGPTNLVAGGGAVGAQLATVTLSAAGLYVIQGKTRIDYASTTVVTTPKVANLDLYRTNNTPVILTNSAATRYTTLSAANALLITVGNLITFQVAYSTNLTTDIIAVRAFLDSITNVSAGNIQAAETWITAQLLIAY